MSKMSHRLNQVVNSRWFSTTIVGVILLAGVLVGLQTYKDFTLRNQHLLNILDQIVLWIFVVEIFIKMGAHDRKPWRYFKDPWNIFDFTIVFICFMPIEGNEFVAVLRLARILRVFKLVTALPKLQILVGALLKSIPSMGYVFVLLLLQFYIYAAMGTFIYSENDPIHFGNLQTSMLSLFRAVTLEDWTDLMYINMYGSDHYGYTPELLAYVKESGLPYSPKADPIGGVIFFVSFILIGSMMVLNLFIGVIMNGMDEMRNEAEVQHMVDMRERDKISLSEEVELIQEQLHELNEHLRLLNQRIKTAQLGKERKKRH